MPDSRLTKLAKILIHYSLELKTGQQFVLRTSPLADELNLAVFEEAIKVGANIFVQQGIPGTEEIFFKYASDDQLDFVSPIRKMVVEEFDALLNIEAAHNTRELSGIDPKRLARFHKASTPIMKTYLDRAAKGELRWCVTVYPTHAMAQDAGMSLNDYREFVFSACMLNEEDPVASWREEGRRQRRLIEWLKGHEKIIMKGSNIDLTLSIKDRLFVESDGKYNLPDGEIFTSPIEDSANGWVRFSYPAIYDGQEVSDIELWFESGKVIEEKAGGNQALLTTLLDTDPGARFLGEWGIGTNYGIQRFTKNMLFDEKLGGTIHLAVGATLPETGGKNESGLHWDMLCDMNDAEIVVDGELFYKNGKPVV